MVVHCTSAGDDGSEDNTGARRGHADKLPPHVPGERVPEQDRRPLPLGRPVWRVERPQLNGEAFVLDVRVDLPRAWLGFSSLPPTLSMKLCSQPSVNREGVRIFYRF